MGKFILAFDQGTTSSRAIVFDEEGQVRGVGQYEFEQIFPKAGWVEHDPEEIWESQWRAARTALEDAGVGGEEIAGLGVTNQRETTLVWDKKTGEPIYRAIVWQDRRTAGVCDGLKASGEERMIQERCGLVADPYFSGTKIAWILDHVTGARERAERGELIFGTVDSWLVWKLTRGAVHVTDVTNASRTLLYDLKRGDWDRELGELLRVPMRMLPRVCSCDEVVGEVALDELKGVPISGIAGDQHAALFGQGCGKSGMVKNTYGTGCFLLMNVGGEMAKSRHGLLSTAGWKVGGEMTYALEGSVFIAGAVVQWLRDGLGVIDSSEEVEVLAKTVEDNGGVYFAPAFTGLGAPHWDAYARGAIFGLTRGSHKGHLARAALESMAYQSVDLVRAMEGDAELGVRELRADGGATRNALLMQFQADVLGVPVVVPKVAETTALGAAFFAGLGVGYWESQEALQDLWQAEVVYEPKMGDRERGKLMEGWGQAVERCQGWEKRV